MFRRTCCFALLLIGGFVGAAAPATAVCYETPIEIDLVPLIPATCDSTQSGEGKLGTYRAAWFDPVLQRAIHLETRFSGGPNGEDHRVTIEVRGDDLRIAGVLSGGTTHRRSEITEDAQALGPRFFEALGQAGVLQVGADDFAACLAGGDDPDDQCGTFTSIIKSVACFVIHEGCMWSGDVEKCGAALESCLDKAENGC